MDCYARVFTLARNDGSFCHFEHSDPMGCKVQAVAKKSKGLKARLLFLDTSLRSVRQCKINTLLRSV